MWLSMGSWSGSAEGTEGAKSGSEGGLAAFSGAGYRIGSLSEIEARGSIVIEFLAMV